MRENELSRILVDCCYRIHRGLGPGLLESTYEEILAYEVKKLGLVCIRQPAIPIMWDGIEFKKSYRADIIIEDLVIIEIKSVETVAPVHYKQLLTYLRLTDLKLGLMVNFNSSLIKNGIKRVVNGL